jgi:hypothetical protein
LKIQQNHSKVVGGTITPLQKNFPPKFDEKKTDLDIFGFLKMSKNGFYTKSFGNASFFEGPYKDRVKF